jgi:hypothetical protein
VEGILAAEVVVEGSLDGVTSILPGVEVGESLAEMTVGMMVDPSVA